MPIGSPGMEQGTQRDAYDVLLVRGDGGTSVFGSYRSNGSTNDERNPTMSKQTLLIAAIAAAGLTNPAISQTTVDHAPYHLAQAAAPAATPMSDGEVRKVDNEAGKLTLKHGPIPNIDMPAMTMVFQVKDKAMLDQVKAGDKIRFAVDRVGGQFTVVKIEPVK